jgi:hypothetical protein
MDENVFVAHEWVEEGKGYREALVPAAVANRYPVELVFANEADEMWWGDAHEPGELP